MASSDQTIERMVIMVQTKKMWLALLGAFVVALVALGMLPSVAHAATNVNYSYKNAAGITQTGTFDLDSMTADTTTYGYMFQKNGVNNVLKADKTVKLADVVEAIKVQEGDKVVDSNGSVISNDTTVWASGKTMTFTTDGGIAYSKFSPFSFDLLNPVGLFFPNTLSTGSPLGTGVNAPTVLALKSGSQAMDPDDDVTTAGEVRDDITTSTSTSPRLLWGWASDSPASNMLGGNRYPSNIYSITIS